MKRIKTILVCGLVLASAGLTKVVLAEGESIAKEATVRAVHGDVTYKIGDGQAQPLRPNMTLPEGATIITGADSTVDLQVNGRTSTVRVTASTTMTLKKMEAMGAARDADSETMLDLQGGTVLGSVKKITKDSRYEISTPRGVAGIRGTDFAVEVTPQANGLFTVTFTSVTGQVICVANVSILGVITPITKTLNTGESWTPPDTANSADTVPGVVPALPGIMTLYATQGPNGPPIVVSLPTPPTVPPYVPPTESGSTDGGSGGSGGGGGGGSQSAD